MHDLEWVSQRRPSLKDAAGIDVALVTQVACKLPATGLREAFESELVGDLVVRHLTKHWQEHDGLCQFGLAEETVDHVFWHSAPATCSNGLATADGAKSPQQHFSCFE